MQIAKTLDVKDTTHYDAGMEEKNGTCTNGTYRPLLKEPENPILPELHELQPGELVGSISDWLRNNPNGVKEILESEVEMAR